VFFIDGVATKIFKRNHSLTDDFIRMVFQSEVDAYLKVQNFPALREITPKFYGPVRFEKILNNAQGLPSAATLMGDCAYQMEYIQAPFIKLGTHPQRGAIEKVFADAGIHYLKDASVTDPSSIVGENIPGVRVIDFSVKEYVPLVS